MGGKGFEWREMFDQLQMEELGDSRNFHLYYDLWILHDDCRWTFSFDDYGEFSFFCSLTKF